MNSWQAPERAGVCTVNGALEEGYDQDSQVKSQRLGVTDQAGKSAPTKDCSHSEDSWTSSKTAPKVAPP